MQENAHARTNCMYHKLASQRSGRACVGARVPAPGSVQPAMSGIVQVVPRFQYSPRTLPASSGSAQRSCIAPGGAPVGGPSALHAWPPTVTVLSAGVLLLKGAPVAVIVISVPPAIEPTWPVIAVMEGV